MAAVLDASVAVDLMLDRERSASAKRVIAGQELVAPAIIDLEVISALTRLERAGELTAAALDNTVRDWQRFPVERLPMAQLLPAVVSLRNNVSVADAFYVALARWLLCPLITSDTRLAAAPGLGIALTIIA